MAKSSKIFTKTCRNQVMVIPNGFLCAQTSHESMDPHIG
jgi:hypothetical protein